MSDILKFARTWWIAILSITAAATAVLAILLAYPALHRTSQFARDGKAAQARLISVAPVSCLNYRDQVRRGVIDARQFAYVTSRKAGFPIVCPAPSLPFAPDIP